MFLTNETTGIADMRGTEMSEESQAGHAGDQLPASSWVVDAKLVDQEELSENRDNLEARLVGLGLVRRLSDSCSFVENPFAKGEAVC